MIRVSDLNKSFDGFQALAELNVNVKKGSIYGLVGTNGARENNTDQTGYRGFEAGQRKYHDRR